MKKKFAAIALTDKIHPHRIFQSLVTAILPRALPRIRLTLTLLFSEDPDMGRCQVWPWEEASQAEALNLQVHLPRGHRPHMHAHSLPRFYFPG